MPEPIDSIDSTDPEVVKKHNADVIRRQAEQDINGLPTNRPDIADSSSALDKLRDEMVKKKETGDVPEPTSEEKAVAEKKAAEDKLKAAGGAAPVPDPEAEKKAAKEARAAADKTEADRKLAEEIFKGSPALPPNASPKSSEAFSSIKSKAAQEISARDAEIKRLQAVVTEAEAKLKNPIPPELDKEVRELREFRVKLDIEADPKFKEFDAKIAAGDDFIYAQLKRSSVITPEILADIKKFGGPAEVKMDKIFEAIKDPMIQRLVEGRLAEIEMVRYEKQKAIEAAKGNVSQYMQERHKEAEAAATAHNTVTRQTLDNIAAKIPWLNEKAVDPKANEDDRKLAETHNAFARQMRSESDLAMQDDSPEMRATLVVGMMQLFRLQALHDASTIKLTRIETELKEANETIAKLKSASVSRLRDSGAPTTGTVPAAKPATTVNINESAGEAMERLRRERQQQQQAAAAA